VNVPLGLLLLGLTGVGPLIAWRRASVSNLKRQFAVPASCGIAVAIILIALGMRAPYALVAYALCGFVTGTILQEFYKGVGARRSIHGESVVIAFVRLVAKNRRRYGGYIVHAGIVMLFAAFAGLAFRSEHDVTLRTGESYEVRDPYGHLWKFVSQGLSTSDRRDRSTLAVALETFRDGKPAGFIASEKRQYLDANKKPLFNPSTEVGIRSTAKLDTYIVLAGARGEQAEIRITFNPLVVWVWIGGFLMMIGGLVVMWPQAERRRAEGGYAAVLPPAMAPADVAVPV
jgi:cytochrome c-type biogenesis protein CcmF